MAENTSIIGNKDITVRESEAREKVTGEAKYTLDIDLPHMLHMKVLHSPHPHATITSFNSSQAEKLPGVVAVVSYKDMIGKTQGSGPTPGVIYDAKMRFVGDAVAAVAAESEDIAEEALGLIGVNYKVHQPLLDHDLAKDETTNRIHGGGNIVGPGAPMASGPSWQWQKGNVDEGFTEADVIVEKTVRTHGQYQAPLEGHDCVADWDPAAEKLTMWISTQAAFRQRDSFLLGLGLPNNKVRIIAPYIGGSHGGKGETLKEYFFAALLSMKAGRPVKYVQNHEEEVATTAIRGGATFQYKVGAKNDGTLTAIDVKCWRDTGGYGTLAYSLIVAVVDYVASVNFKCPNISEQSWGVFTNKLSTGGYRGFGYFEGNVGFGPIIDELIEKLDMDPIEFHLKNLPVKGDLVGYEQAPLTSFGLQEGIQTCADMVGWEQKWHKPGEYTLPDGRKHGIGLGIVIGCAVLGKWGQSTVEVRIEWDGTVTVLTGCCELGMGQTTGLCQMAAEGLGARFEDVSVIFSDTDHTPLTIPQASSNTTVNTGWPCKLAAEDAKRQVLDMAAKKMGNPTPNINPLIPPIPAMLPGVTPDELDTKDSRVFLKSNPEIGIKFSELFSMPNTIIGKGTKYLAREDNWFKQPNACICEVAVDTETGEVEILRSVIAVDCGRAVSPTRVQAQFESVLSGGMGYVLSEEPVWDPTTGAILNTGWADYKLPTTMDSSFATLDPIVLVEPYDEFGPFGAKGSGEAGICPMASALPNAIYNAIGVRFDKTPLTPDKILEALGNV